MPDDAERLSGPRSLDTSLEQIRLDGAIFFRGEFTEQWSFESPLTEIAGIMRPGAERMILFHIVAAGTCWVSVVDGDRHWAQRGDVIVLPYGDDYAMGGTGLDAEAVPILSLLSSPPWDHLPVLRHGAGGERTDIVCGYLFSEDPLFDPAIRAFPPVFVVRPPPGPTAEWVTSSVGYALAAGSDATRPPASTRLHELLLIEVMRLHLASAPAADHGWLAALRDPVLAPALARMHGAPERKWTVADLAAEVAVSRSVLDDRFRTVLGRSPIRYLTEWRMHVADDLLATTTHNLGEVARRVGYDAEESFSRAFKRSRGVAPGTWRAERLRTG